MIMGAHGLTSEVICICICICNFEIQSFVVRFYLAGMRWICVIFDVDGLTSKFIDICKLCVFVFAFFESDLIFVR